MTRRLEVLLSSVAKNDRYSNNDLFNIHRDMLGNMLQCSSRSGMTKGISDEWMFINYLIDCKCLLRTMENIRRKSCYSRYEGFICFILIKCCNQTFDENLPAPVPVNCSFTAHLSIVQSTRNISFEWTDIRVYNSSTSNSLLRFFSIMSSTPEHRLDLRRIIVWNLPICSSLCCCDSGLCSK